MLSPEPRSHRRFTRLFLAGLAGLLLSSLWSSDAQSASLDPGFGVGGVVRTQNEDLSDPQFLEAVAVKETQTGELLVLGNQHQNEGESDIYSDVLALARYKSDGTPDGDFGTGGVWSGLDRNRPAIGYGRDLAVDQFGRAVTVGLDVPLYHLSGNWTNDCASAARFKTTGALDIGFASNGIKSTCLARNSRNRFTSLGGHQTVGLDARSVSIRGDQKILVGGMVLNHWSDTGPFIARLKMNGQLDRSFRGGSKTDSGQDGIVEILRGKKHDGQVNDLRALRKKKILAVGQLDGDFFAARLLDSGSLDKTFSFDGIARFDFDGIRNWPGSFAVDSAFDSSGRIVIAGYSTKPSGVDQRGRVVVVRLRPNGQLDRNFNGHGFTSPQLPWNFKTTGLAIQRDGKTVVSGTYVSAEENDRFALLRFTRQGRLDSTFFDDGVFAPGSPEIGNRANAVSIDRFGRIVAVGGPDFTVIRILPQM